LTDKEYRPLYTNNIGVYITFCMTEKDKETLYISNVGVYVMF